MNLNLLDKEVQAYLNENINQKLSEFALKKSPFENISAFELTVQLQGKQISLRKFPFLNNEIIFPNHLNLEQSTSQIVAEYKSTLFKGNSGIDLTLGFGIDAFFIAKNFKTYTGIEPNLALLNIDIHNFSVLKIDNFKFIHSDAEIFLKDNQQNFDLIYLDPDRRNNQKKNIILADLTPNILEIKEKLFSFSKQIAIKLSPLIDLKNLIFELKFIQKIHLISLKNELKEVLIVLESKENYNPKIHCVNLCSNQDEYIFHYEDEISTQVFNYSKPQKYIYIPNVSILKSGCYKLISQNYKMAKLDANTHIYTSNQLENFCGFCFEVLDFNLDLKKIKKQKANIISKNYPLETEQIKKKYQLKDGGELFYLFTKSCGKLIVLALKKKNNF